MNGILIRFAGLGSKPRCQCGFAFGFGQPVSDDLSGHVERQNLTMRMMIRRLTRLTNAFSKKWENLWAALCLHFAFYNFCRIHRTIRVTPAMEAGITNRVWTLAELVAA